MPQLLVDWLTEKFPTAKRQTLKRMVEQRRVRINGRPATKLKQPVEAGDEIRVGAAPEPRKASARPLDIIHEDADIIVVHKPAGLLTSTVPNERRPTAIAILRRYLADHEPAARVGVIHRLDRDASGLLVFSKNALAYESLKGQFYKHSVERVYLAVVEGSPEPPEGRIESNLVELPEGKMRSTLRPGSGQHAVSEYRVVRQEKERALVRVTLLTGRKHQIRAHLSEKGHPIVGDAMYGAARYTGPLMLAAVKLVLDHPRSGRRVTFEIPMPETLQPVVEP